MPEMIEAIAKVLHPEASNKVGAACSRTGQKIVRLQAAPTLLAYLDHGTNEISLFVIVQDILLGANENKSHLRQGEQWQVHDRNKRSR